MKGLTELQETKELWNLGDGLENVCNSVMRKLHHAGYVLEERNRTIINLDSYEVTAMIWATWIQQANNKRRPKKIKNQYGEWDYRQPLPEKPWEGDANGKD